MVSSVGSIISVVATYIFLYILYIQLIKGETSLKYQWLTPQLYSDLFQSIFNRNFLSLEWCLNSPPKPHAFTSLPMMSVLIPLAYTTMIVEQGNGLYRIYFWVYDTVRKMAVVDEFSLPESKISSRATELVTDESDYDRYFRYIAEKSLSLDRYIENEIMSQDPSLRKVLLESYLKEFRNNFLRAKGEQLNDCPPFIPDCKYKGLLEPGIVNDGHTWAQKTHLEHCSDDLTDENFANDPDIQSVIFRRRRKSSSPILDEAMPAFRKRKGNSSTGGNNNSTGNNNTGNNNDIDNGINKSIDVNKSIDIDEVLNFVKNKLSSVLCQYGGVYANPDWISDSVLFSAIITGFLTPALWIFKHLNINESNVNLLVYWLPYIPLSFVILGIIFSLISGTFQKQIKQRDYLSLSLYPLYLINSISCIYFGYGWLLISLAIFLLSIFIAKKTKSYKQWGNFRKGVYIFNGLYIIVRVFKAINGIITTISFDTPEPWATFFQDSGSPQMEALEELHNNIMFYLAIVLFAVTWIMGSIIISFSKTKIANKYVNHGTLIELIWTITPALILILIAFPSFKLLYLMDEVIDPAIVIHGEGHQWYWSYQYPDFTNVDEEYIEFDSYIIPESDLEQGNLRMLEVDNRVILPELTHVRFVVEGADVIHSYACPSLGIKCDAYPGRLNQSSVYLNREGSYFGQCSEICGILHSSMPIAIQCVSLNKFLYWLYDQMDL